MIKEDERLGIVRFGSVYSVIWTLTVPLLTKIWRCYHIHLRLSRSAHHARHRWGIRRESEAEKYKEETHRTCADLHFPRCTIHLIPEPFDIIERINDDDIVSTKTALNGSKQRPASRLL